MMNDFLTALWGPYDVLRSRQPFVPQKEPRPSGALFVRRQRCGLFLENESVAASTSPPARRLVRLRCGRKDELNNFAAGLFALTIRESRIGRSPRHPPPAFRLYSELTQSLSQRPYFACLMPQPLARGDRLCGVVAVVRSLGSTRPGRISEVAAFLGRTEPVFAPRGAALWQGSPLLHAGFGVHHHAFVQMSVGFIRVSPYWQYVTVWRKRFPLRREERRRCFYLAICSSARNLWR
jgi:hypothetical protein